MLKPTTISIAMDTSKIENVHKLIDSLLYKIKAYNKEVAKSNRLLREEEKLRKELGITVKKGVVQGIIKKEGSHENNEQRKTIN